MGYFAGVGVALGMLITLATGGHLESKNERAEAARNNGASAAQIVQIMNEAE